MESIRGQKAKVIESLNYRKPEHPPDIYFIRRNYRFLDRYLDPDEMQTLKSEAGPSLKPNYDLFKLDPKEKGIMNTLINQKRNLVNPHDPFYNKYGDHFSKQYKGLYATDKILQLISPRDHTDLKNQSNEQIKYRSKILMKQVCDRESAYMPKRNSLHQQVSRRPDSNAQQIKPPRKHDILRKNKAESMKLRTIELELMESRQLKQVEHDEDSKEFEGITNMEFNRNFQNELRESNESQQLKDMNMMKDKQKRRSGTQGGFHNFRMNDVSVENFTFTKRYARNRYHGRITSVLQAPVFGGKLPDVNNLSQTARYQTLDNSALRYKEGY